MITQKDPEPAGLRSGDFVGRLPLVVVAEEKRLAAFAVAVHHSHIQYVVVVVSGNRHARIDRGKDIRCQLLDVGMDLCPQLPSGCSPGGLYLLFHFAYGG